MVERKCKNEITSLEEEGGVKKPGYRFHLLVYSGWLIWRLRIAEGNKQKRQSHLTLPLPSSD